MLQGTVCLPRLRALPKEGELIPPLSEGHGDGATDSVVCLGI